MEYSESAPITRRKFISRSSAALTGVILSPSLAAFSKHTPICLVVDDGDPVASSPQARHALQTFQSSLHSHGILSSMYPHLDDTPEESVCIIVSGPDHQIGTSLMETEHVILPDAEESLCLLSTEQGKRTLLLACGTDPRGLVYAVLELADRLDHAPTPETALYIPAPILEQPANRVRAINRAFCSDLEDKPWFYDHRMWVAYLSMLATHRYNRFNFTLGLAYDFNRNVSDCYFHFAYPFLVDVPGYHVQAVGLLPEERDRNLEMLRFISDQAAKTGIEFQLGIWTHAYEWTDSPEANYTISGLNPENHAEYCRDALEMLLRECPGITGVTIRIHGESGVPDGSYEFWRTVFSGIPRSGRKIVLEMHAKGTDRKIIDVARETGMSVSLAPKYWAEHFGLPYHQSAIRDREMVPDNVEGEVLMKLSRGSRRFMRYGYGDLLKNNRDYRVVYRMFPGLRRVLLWGDPLTAAGFGRASHFCDADGVDFMEPLFFKGRRGSGEPGGRCSYKKNSLKPNWDWQKFLYSYRIWGRLHYNPDSEADVWQRFTRKHFHRAAGEMEQAMAHATRILQIFLTAHGSSAAHNNVWPEMYWNMSIVEEETERPYLDTRAPRRFGNVSPFDPQLFLSLDETADMLLEGSLSPSYTQIEAAAWMFSNAEAALACLEAAREITGTRYPAEFERWEVDILIQAGLGRFFAAKFRSAILWALFVQSGYREALECALEQYEKAFLAWETISSVTDEIYMDNVSYGQEPFLSGHWRDRIPRIREDIDKMAAYREGKERKGLNKDFSEVRVKQAIEMALGTIERDISPCRHDPPEAFVPGEPVPVKVSMEEKGSAGNGLTATLYYREVNQSRKYQVLPMRRESDRFEAVIPGEYSRSPYPLQYYIAFREGRNRAWIYPGLGKDLCQQPYVVIPQK